MRVLTFILMTQNIGHYVSSNLMNNSIQQYTMSLCLSFNHFALFLPFVIFINHNLVVG